MQYLKIKEVIVEQIDSGQLSSRQKLPAERKLAELFDTTRVTLREALSLLEAEGRIYREDRRGWFISPSPLKYDPALALNFMEMARSQDRVPMSQMIDAKSELATKRATQILQLPPFSDVIKIERAHYLEARPVAYVKSYIRSQRFPKLLGHLFNNDLAPSLTDIYKEHYHTQYGQVQYRVSTTSLLGDAAHHLRATVGSPAMLVQRTHYDKQGEVIDCDLEYWRHDAICIESRTILG